MKVDWYFIFVGWQWVLIASRINSILGLALDFYSVQQTLSSGGAVSAIKARCDKEVDRIHKQFDDCIAFLLRVCLSLFFFSFFCLVTWHTIIPPFFLLSKPLYFEKSIYLSIYINHYTFILGKISSIIYSSQNWFV